MTLIEQLKKQLSPEVVKVELSNGVTLYVRKPKVSEQEQCSTPKGMLLVCVCRDETGYPLFSEEDEEGKVNINDVDALLAGELVTECLKLWKGEDGNEDNAVDEVAKKS